MLRIDASAPGGMSFIRGRSLRSVAITTALAAPLLIGAVSGLGVLTAPPGRNADPEVTGSIARPPLAIQASLLDPTPMLGRDTPRTWSALPPAPGLTRAQPTAAPAKAEAPAKTDPIAALLAPAAPAISNATRPSQSPASIPLPAPRPAGLTPAAAPAATVARDNARPAQRRARAAGTPSTQADNRSWFEKLFDLNAPPAPRVSYTALDSRALDVQPRARLTPTPLAAPAGEGGTAVYDISARTVTLPSGERLEAHSGLREKMDDPRFVHVRMRGATPPGTYELTEREALFHGVRAIRLNPVGGSAAIFGRTGILAHSYLLGPNGDSNGCMSFKDYDRFLQAYLRGEIRRLVVVPGNGQDRLPATAARNGNA